MHVNPVNLDSQIIQPCLAALGIERRGLNNLLVATAVFESHQLALKQSDQDRQQSITTWGIYRISAATHRQIWDYQLIRNPEMASQIRGFASQRQFLQNPDGELEFNLLYATAIAALIYLREPSPSKPLLNIRDMANAWSLGFDNGTGEARNPEQFIKLMQAHDLAPTYGCAA